MEKMELKNSCKCRPSCKCEKCKSTYFNLDNVENSKTEDFARDNENKK